MYRNWFQAHRMGVFILRNRAGFNPTAHVTDDFGNLVKINGMQFNVSTYGHRNLH